MEQWIKRLGSALCSALLTFSLSTAAFADAEEQDPVLPEVPAQIIETPAEEGLSPAVDADQEEPDPAPPDEEAGPDEDAEAPADEAGNVDPSDGESGAAAPVDEEADPGEDAEAPAEEETDPGEEAQDPADGDDEAPDLSNGESDAAAYADEEADPGEDAEAPADEAAELDVLPAENGGEASSDAETDAMSDDAAGQTDAASDAEKPRGSGNTISQTSDGIYVMVNHSGTEDLSAEGDITILAAGVNRVSSISGTGKVRIAGTGILLVDSLQGDLDLLTLTDIYSKGSVAVFVRQADGSYLLVNGDVPGILDEEYRIEGYTLVVPEGASLLLCGTGAEPRSDGSVAYYHGTDHDYKAENFNNVMEMAGKLTIAEKAELIIRQGASLILENLKSLGHGDLEDSIYRHPTLTVESDGKLTVDGTVGSGGVVNIGAESALSGSGSISADKLTIGDPSAIEHSHVSLSAGDLYLYGDGSIPELAIHDSRVHVGSGAIRINGLSSSGSSMMILPAGFELNIEKIDGSLALRQTCSYEYIGTTYENSGYNDSRRVVVSGDMLGEGTISFQSGIFDLLAGSKLNSVSVSDAFGGIVYDYAGVLTTSLLPLHVQPAALSFPSAEGETVEIPLAAAYLEENPEKNGGNWIAIKGSIPNLISVSATVFDAGDEKIIALDLDRLKADLLRKKDVLTGQIIVELVRKSADGTLHTDFYHVNSLGGWISAEDICLIRVLSIEFTSFPEPDSSSTMTGMNYTGSGILGGSGAGSVHFGSTDPDHRPDPDPQPDPAPEPEPDPEPDPEPEPEPEPDPQPDEKKEESKTPSDSRDAATLQVWATWEGDAYLLHAKMGERILSALDTDVDVFMDYTPTEQTAGKPLYAVFRGADGRLRAFRASYGQLTGILHFRTNLLGSFVIVGFEFDGEEFSDAFYSALEDCAEIAALS